VRAVTPAEVEGPLVSSFMNDEKPGRELRREELELVRGAGERGLIDRDTLDTVLDDLVEAIEPGSQIPSP
jgi:hypothetical protein